MASITRGWHFVISSMVDLCNLSESLKDSSKCIFNVIESFNALVVDNSNWKGSLSHDTHGKRSLWATYISLEYHIQVRSTQGMTKTTNSFVFSLSLSLSLFLYWKYQKIEIFSLLFSYLLYMYSYIMYIYILHKNIYREDHYTGRHKNRKEYLMM